MVFKLNPEVLEVLEKYPESVQEKLNYLRNLILETAEEIDEVQELKETLKWGEPSYQSPKGGTLRIDWKSKTPEQYAMYFTCSSQLVPTFRVLFPDVFQFEGNRALIFPLDMPLPEKELKKCIRAALLYHKVKRLPFLGIT